MNSNFRLFYLFLTFAFLQILVFNQLEFGFGIHIMVYPLYLLLLPVSINSYMLLAVSFLLGFLIDVFTNTYGLHASSALVFVYLRPYVFSFYSQMEKYEAIKELNIFEMGSTWFLKVFSSLLLFHHLWFFVLEIFNFGELFFILKNTFLSLPFSILGSLILSVLISKRSRL